MSVYLIMSGVWLNFASTSELLRMSLYLYWYLPITIFISGSPVSVCGGIRKYTKYFSNKLRYIAWFLVSTSYQYTNSTSFPREESAKNLTRIIYFEFLVGDNNTNKILIEILDLKGVVLGVYWIIFIWLFVIILHNTSRNIVQLYFCHTWYTTRYGLLHILD